MDSIRTIPRDIIEASKGSLDAIGMYLILNEKIKKEEILSVYVLTKSGIDPLLIREDVPLQNINFHYLPFDKGISLTNGYVWLIENKIEVSKIAIKYLYKVGEKYGRRYCDNTG